MIKEASMYSAKWKHHGLKTCKVHEFQKAINNQVNHVLVVITLIM